LNILSGLRKINRNNSAQKNVKRNEKFLGSLNKSENFPKMENFHPY